LACPVTIHSGDDGDASTVAAGDLSDGGMFAAVPVSQAPAVDSKVDVTFCIPRESDRIDCFSSVATVVRLGAMRNKALAGVALQFKKPVPLLLG
jgi:hypothetical protein